MSSDGMHYKTLRIAPLGDRDRTAEMRSALSHHNRYNAPTKTRAFDGDPMVRASTRSTRRIGDETR